ncbi:MAG: hypothetical protein JWO43_533 [Candidatus Adlerbacteria bacterium]|nr:hypothetical protein [Candidatus Adlerbacteria bacterium]
MSQRVQLPESRVRANRMRRRKRITIAVIAAVLVVCGSVIGSTWLPQWRIVDVDISGTQSVATSTIAKYVHEQLQGTYALVFPRNNVLLFSKSKLAADIPVEIPTIKKATVSIENLHTLGISVVERGPVAVWCGSVPAEQAPCYLLDATGSAYALSADYSGDVYVHYFGSTTLGTLPYQYLTPVQFETLTALATTLNQKTGGSIVTAVAVSDSDDVTATFSNGFNLMFTLMQDPADVVSRFALAQTSGAFNNRTLGSFEYLDLRFGDKLYYKLKGGMVASSTPATGTGQAATTTVQ